MKSTRRRLRHAIGTALLLAAASAVAFANQGAVLLSGPAVPLCYCHCPYENGVRHCTKMCELPQYQNRWWAVSCRKKNSIVNESSTPAPPPASKKTNRKEHASL